jgi:hypothetical protein
MAGQVRDLVKIARDTPLLPPLYFLHYGVLYGTVGILKDESITARCVAYNVIGDELTFGPDEEAVYIPREDIGDYIESMETVKLFEATYHSL